MIQIVLLLGISGACRREELTNMKVTDIRIEKDFIHVKIPTTKTHISRSFTLEGNYMQLVVDYINSRPAVMKTDRLFVYLKDGQVTNKPIGKNTIGNMVKRVAAYLNLPNANLYTGHSYRRTSASALADSGADMDTIKRHGGWKSTKAAEGYIEDSVGNKRRIGNRIIPNKNISDEPASKKQKGLDGNPTFHFSFNFNNINPNTANLNQTENNQN